MKKNLKIKLDKLWSELVKQNAKGMCEICGKRERLNSHHFYSRSNYSVRWDLGNGFALCPYHHTLGNWSAHKNPAEFVEFAIEKRGRVWYENLRAKKNKIFKKSEWDSVYADLKLKEKLLTTIK